MDSQVASAALPSDLAAALKRDENGLVCAVAQDATTGAVLMVAYMDDTALAQTLMTGQAWYFSRSRQTLWRKGETSGHTQQVRSIALDCDHDTLVLQVDQRGPACHTGADTCFTDRVIWTADRGYNAAATVGEGAGT